MIGGVTKPVFLIDVRGQICHQIISLRFIVLHTNRTLYAQTRVIQPDKLIHMTVPSDRNIALKEIEKISKYKDLELEIQRMWHMKTIVIPVVVSALGTVKKGMKLKKTSRKYPRELM